MYDNRTKSAAEKRTNSKQTNYKSIDLMSMSRAYYILHGIE